MIAIKGIKLLKEEVPKCYLCAEDIEDGSDVTLSIDAEGLVVAVCSNCKNNLEE